MTNQPTTEAERSRRYRDRKRGGPKRTPAGCPSLAASIRHRKTGSVCADPAGCDAAIRAYWRANAAAARARRATTTTATAAT